MIRVLGTIQRSQYANSFQSQQNDLTNWVREIHGGMYSLIVRLILKASYRTLSDCRIWIELQRIILQLRR